MRKIVIKSALLQKNIAKSIFLEYESIHSTLCEVNRKYSKKGGESSYGFPYNILCSNSRINNSVYAGSG